MTTLSRITLNPSAHYMSIWQSLKSAKRSSTDRWIGGVCGGLGTVTPVPSWLWRALLLFFALAFGVGLLFYVVLWICMPSDKSGSESGGAISKSP